MNGKDKKDDKKMMGDGNPIVVGTVSAINGSTLTVQNNAGATYSVDVSAAKIQKKGVTNATISNIVIGDRVLIQGTVSGTSVTATTVIDQPVGTNNEGGKNRVRTAISSFGNFFKHLFGF